MPFRTGRTSSTNPGMMPIGNIHKDIGRRYEANRTTGSIPKRLEDDSPSEQ